MSLFRQLWLTLIATTVLTFSGAFLVSMMSASDYLEDQLSIKNNDNANSLALAISHLAKDAVTIELQITAVFDTGQYALIRIRDPEGKIIVEKTDDLQDDEVPHWFTQLFPIASPPGVAYISSGWRQFGSVELISHPHFAYRELWNGAQRLLLWFICGGLVIELIGLQILFRVKRPLDAVVGQAKAISKRHFVQIDVPTTAELKSLALAMNAMVLRVKAMFDEEASHVEALCREASLDNVTGLIKRSHFMNQLEHMLNDNDAPALGSLIVLRLADLADINRRHGHEHANQILRHLAQGLNKVAEAYPSATVGRLKGSEFALLLPGEANPEASMQQLVELLYELETSGMLQARQIGYVGSATYHHQEPRTSLLGRIDAAIAAAEGDGSIACRRAMEELIPSATNNADRRKLLEHALTHQGLRLAEFPVIHRDGSLLHLECPLRLRTETGEWLAASNFIPLAGRLEMTCELDLAAVRLALAHLTAGTPAIAVNLSSVSISHIAFCQQLRKLIANHHELAPRLWLEVAESGAFRHFEAFTAFAQLMSPQGCHLGIEHFGQKIGEINQLRGIGIDYLKVDNSFVRNIDEHADNQAFLKGLCAIAHQMELTVIAEGVSTPAELATLPTLGLDAFTGPAVSRPEDLAG